MPSRDKKPSQIKEESSTSELMRRFKANPFLFIGTVLVLVIIVVAFVFVPAIVPDAFGAGDLTFGTYNRIPINYVQGNHFHQVLQFLMQRHQPAHDDPNFMLAVAQIWRHAFEEAVIRIGILEKMRQAGFIVPEDVMNREMAELPHFQENGRFSSARYRAMDNNTRMTLWRQVQESYIVDHYLSDLENIQTSSREVSFVSSMASPNRTFDLAVFPLSSYPDSEIISFAEANQDLFDTVRISSITLNSEREARQILNSIRNGLVSFEEAAQNHSQDWAADRGGDMGTFLAFELSWLIGNEEARRSIVNLARGEITDVFSVPAGWAFYRVDEAAHRTDINDPTQQARIRSYFMQNMRGRIEDWAIAEAERFTTLARQIGFDGAIAAEGLTKRTFGPIPLNFGNSVLFASVSATGVPELEAAGDDIFFWRAAFTTPLNSISRPIVFRDNVMVLLPLEEVPMDENDIAFIESFYPHWIRSSTEGAYRAYFLNSENLDDRFNETFWRLWR
jgi:hypothetical protein